MHHTSPTWAAVKLWKPGICLPFTTLNFILRERANAADVGGEKKSVELKQEEDKLRPYR